jgi:hypothetical protein
VLKRHGIECSNSVIDTMLASQLLGLGRERGADDVLEEDDEQTETEFIDNPTDNALDAVVRRYLGVSIDPAIATLGNSDWSLPITNTCAAGGKTGRAKLARRDPLPSACTIIHTDAISAPEKRGKRPAWMSDIPTGALFLLVSLYQGDSEQEGYGTQKPVPEPKQKLRSGRVNSPKLRANVGTQRSIKELRAAELAAYV